VWLFIWSQQTVSIITCIILSTMCCFFLFIHSWTTKLLSNTKTQYNRIFNDRYCYNNSNTYRCLINWNVILYRIETCICFQWYIWYMFLIQEFVRFSVWNLLLTFFKKKFLSFIIITSNVITPLGNCSVYDRHT